MSSRLNGAVLVEGPDQAVRDVIEAFKDLAKAKEVRVLLCRSSSHKFWLQEIER